MATVRVLAPTRTGVRATADAAGAVASPSRSDSGNGGCGVAKASLWRRSAASNPPPHGWSPVGRDPLARFWACRAHPLAARVRRASFLAGLALLVPFVVPAPAIANEPLIEQAQEIEAYARAYPKRALAELTALIPNADIASTAERRYVYALYGQSMVLAGRNAEALELADRIEAHAKATQDDLALATALLVRANVQLSAGDTAQANTLAKEVRDLAAGSADFALQHWASLYVGIAARGLGRREECLDSLQEALSFAERADNPYRRSSAMYQLSVLYLMLKQPEKAFQTAQEAFRHSEIAHSAFGMANAKMAESAALELLNDPARELAALEEALAIARTAQSKSTESKALINLADIKLRRKQFTEALDLSRRSLVLAKEFEDISLMATSKANIGFALFGLGRTQEGKRFADEALADYEATRATAEIASLLGEYGQYLERSGDYRGALALYHRERKLNDEISLTTHDKIVLEMQEKYESEKRKREIELLNRDNDLMTAEIEHRALRQRVWWLLALVFGASLVVVGVLHHKLRTTNRLLALKNRELSVQSHRDPLTSLYNRRYFQEFITEEAAHPERRHALSDADPIQALLLIDIDHFKQINDRYGHASGDAALVEISRRLREALRETDMIVRWGGEEFLVFVPATHAEKLDEIAMRIMRTVSSEPVVCQGNAIHLTASIGYAPMPLPPDATALSWERAINLVDMALYMAKVHGRNRAYGICGLRRSDDDAMAAVERDLELAWKNGIVDMHTLRGAGTQTAHV